MTSKKTVLVVDDDNSLRRVMEYTLHEAGYRVVTAENGVQGLAIFQSESPAVVITDIQMPGKGVVTSPTITEDELRMLASTAAVEGEITADDAALIDGWLLLSTSDHTVAVAIPEAP